MTHTFAQKPAAKDAQSKAHSSKHSASPKVKPAFTPVLFPVIQRCACGSSCPSCQAEKEENKVLPIQTKLGVGAPNDKYEQEADRIAEQVMRMSEPQVQRVCACGGGCPQCQKDQTRQERARLQTRHLQMGDTRQIEAPPKVREVLAAPGQPLNSATREFMEPRFGHDFGRVRVHVSDEATRDLAAHAFTVGDDVVFGAHRYTPSTAVGQQLLAHELVHVLQQRAYAGGARIQRQTTHACRAFSSEEQQRILTELQAGISRLQAILAGRPEPGRSAVQTVNHRAWVAQAIERTNQLLEDLSTRRLHICVHPDPCSGPIDACFIPTDNSIRIKESIMPPDRLTTSHLLHEYVHYHQNQEAAVRRSALVHTELDELNREYEAFVIASLFNGISIALPPSAHARSGELVERSGGRHLPEMLEETIPREVLTFALEHGPRERAMSLDQLPHLRRAYSRQLARNARVILYPAEWTESDSESGNPLMLRTLSGHTVSLGSFHRAELEVGLPVRRAFWASRRASTEYRDGHYRRGIIMVHSSGRTIAQISVGSSPPPTSFLSEGTPLQDQPIRVPRP